MLAFSRNLIRLNFLAKSPVLRSLLVPRPVFRFSGNEEDKTKIELTKQQFNKINAILSGLESDQVDQKSQAQGQQQKEERLFSSLEQVLSLKLLQMTTSSQVVQLLQQHKEQASRDINILFLFVYIFSKYESPSSSQSMRDHFKSILTNKDRLNKDNRIKCYELLYNQVLQNNYTELPAFPASVPKDTELEELFFLHKIYPSQARTYDAFRTLRLEQAEQNPQLYLSLVDAFQKMNMPSDNQILQNCEALFKDCEDPDMLSKLSIQCLQKRDYERASSTLQKIDLSILETDTYSSILIVLVVEGKDVPELVRIRDVFINHIEKLQVAECTSEGYMNLWSVLPKLSTHQLFKTLAAKLIDHSQLVFDLKGLEKEQLFQIMMTLGVLNLKNNSQFIRETQSAISLHLAEFSADQLCYLAVAAQKLQSAAKPVILQTLQSRSQELDGKLKPLYESLKQKQ